MTTATTKVTTKDQLSLLMTTATATKITKKTFVRAVITEEADFLEEEENEPELRLLRRKYKPKPSDIDWCDELLEARRL